MSPAEEQKLIDDVMLKVGEYANHISNWTIIKTEMLKWLPIECRQRFARRDDYTKKPNINEFELSLIEKWRVKHGVQLIIKT